MFNFADWSLPPLQPQHKWVVKTSALRRRRGQLLVQKQEYKFSRKKRSKACRAGFLTARTSPDAAHPQLPSSDKAHAGPAAQRTLQAAAPTAIPRHKHPRENCSLLISNSEVLHKQAQVYTSVCPILQLAWGLQTCTPQRAPQACALPQAPGGRHTVTGPCCRPQLMSAHGHRANASRSLWFRNICFWLLNQLNPLS